MYLIDLLRKLNIKWALLIMLVIPAFKYYEYQKRHAGGISISTATTGLKAILDSSNFNGSFSFLEENLTVSQIDGSILHFGSRSRFNYRLLNLLSKRNSTLRIGVIGGSNSINHLFKESEKYFFEHLTAWFQKLLQSAVGIEVTRINAAWPATNSEFYASCFDQMIDRQNIEKLDILLLELAINDMMPTSCPTFAHNFQPLGRPMEELIRAIRRFNPTVDIVQVNLIQTPYFFGNGSVNCKWVDDQDYLTLAQHYEVGSIQWKHIFCDVSVRSETDFLKKYTSGHHHCNHLIHQHMGRFLINYYQKSIKQLYEQLSLNPGDSYLADLKESLSTTWQLHYSKPVFNTTWLDGGDCFLLEARYRTRIEQVMRRNSARPMNKNGSQTVLHVGGLTYSKLFHQPSKSPEFRVRAPPHCRYHGGALPDLSLYYRLYRPEKEGTLEASVLYKINDETNRKSYTVEEKYTNITLPICGYFHHHMLPLSRAAKPGQEDAALTDLRSKICRKTGEEIVRVESIDVTLVLVNDKQWFGLYGLIVNFRCCDQATVTEEPFQLGF